MTVTNNDRLVFQDKPVFHLRRPEGQRVRWQESRDARRIASNNGPACQGNSRTPSSRLTATNPPRSGWRRNRLSRFMKKSVSRHVISSLPPAARSPYLALLCPRVCCIMFLSRLTVNLSDPRLLPSGRRHFFDFAAQHLAAGLEFPGPQILQILPPRFLLLLHTSRRRPRPIRARLM